MQRLEHSLNLNLDKLSIEINDFKKYLFIVTIKLLFLLQ